MATSIGQFLIFDIWGSAKVQPWNSPQQIDCVEMPVKCKSTATMPEGGAEARAVAESKINDDELSNVR